MVAMVALLFILRGGRSGSFSPFPRQACAPAAVNLPGSPPADEKHPPLRLFQGTRGPCGRVSVKSFWWSSLSGNDRIEAYTRSRLPPQSAPFADLSTLGPVIVIRFYSFVTALCKRKGYTQEKLCGYNPFRPRVNGVEQSLSLITLRTMAFYHVTARFTA